MRKWSGDRLTGIFLTRTAWAEKVWQSMAFEHTSCNLACMTFDNQDGADNVSVVVTSC